MAQKNLTVLQLLPALESGGVERGTLEIASGLVAAGHRSLVVSAGGQLVSRLTNHGSEHLTLAIGEKSIWSLRYIRPLRRYMRQNQVDIVHVRSRLPAWIGWLALRGIPLAQRPRWISTVHGLYSVKAYSRIMVRAEAVIAVSETARRYILDQYKGVDSQNVHVIERGIDTTVFPYAYRPPESWLARWYQEHPYLLERQVLTLPGRISRRKGHVDFLHLLSKLVKDDLPVYGLIVGAEDPAHAGYMQELQALVQKLDLASSVTFTGHRMDVRDIYSASDLVLSLSQKPESFGRTVREALSMGVPVVGYDHGGVGETMSAVFPQGQVPFYNADELESVTRQLLAVPAEVEACNFSTVGNMVDKTLLLYDQMARV